MASGKASRRKRLRVLIPTIVILVVLLVGWLVFTAFYTDWLWFGSVNQTVVFTTTLRTRVALFAIFGLVMAFGIWLVMWLAYRFRPTFDLVSTPEQASLDRYRMALTPYRRIIAIAICAVLGLFAGVSAQGEWTTFLAWRNATDFGVSDPQFGLDMSFYVFTYPFVRFILGFLFALVILALITSVVVNYIYGGLRLQPARRRASRAAQAQLSALIAIFVLLKSVAYWYDRFGLAIKSDGLVPGFTGLKYADVNANLPALTILTFVAALVGILFIANIFLRRWAVAGIGFGLLVLTAILLGAAFPAFVQQFQVNPSALIREQPYIDRNIQSTRHAYGVDSAEIGDYPGTVTPPSADVLDASKGTLNNIRLLDPAVVAPTFQQLQQVRAYYAFTQTLDIDRYKINGVQRGAVVSVRDINIAGVPDNQRNWANDHAVYTHGYGFVSAYDNTAQSSGQPDFFESDIPETGALAIDQPRIYFGENSPTFSVVGAPAGSEPRELDYPDDQTPGGQKLNTYDGTGGASVGSFFQRLVFATKFQDSNILLSDLINSDSRILWDREPLSMVEKVAPWLTLDQDPYPAVINGRVVWIVDGYTTTENYSYSSRVSLSDATSDSISVRTASSPLAPDDQVNYVRNSVKATVDAYDGTVHLYAWDENDPILQTWSKVFPGLIESKSNMPSELVDHIRYPEDLFKLQRIVLSRYHVTDPTTFYNGTDFWIVPFDPTQSVQVFQPPYYLTLQMPGQTAPTFSLTTTFAPQRRQTLAAFMAVDSAPGPGYGTIRVLQLPSNTTIPGPEQVQNNFESDPIVSSQLSLLRKGGSEVNLGNLLSLPFNGGLLYVEPVYIQATQGGYPLLRKVLAGYGGNVAMEDTLAAALTKVFSATPNPSPDPNPDPGPSPSPSPSPDPSPSPSPSPNPSPSPSPTTDPYADLAAAISDAQTAYEAGQTALATSDFAAYGVAQKALEDALARAAAAEKRINGSGAPA